MFVYLWIHECIHINMYAYTFMYTHNSVYAYTCIHIHTCTLSQSSCILLRLMTYWGYSRIRYYTAARMGCMSSGSLVRHWLANKWRLWKVVRPVGPTLWWRVVVITSRRENGNRDEIKAPALSASATSSLWARPWVNPGTAARLKVGTQHAEGHWTQQWL